MFQGLMLISIISCIVFSPVLLIISIVNLLIKHNFKYLISFLLMEIYGYILMTVGDPTSVWFKGDVVSYFLISIPATILFIKILIFFI